jgi:methylated-DNA-[protein]-cysteine S-methyltransferase
MTPANDPQLFPSLHVATMESPIGRVWIESDGLLITRVSFDPLPVRRARQPLVLQQALASLDAYFNGRSKKFRLPLQQRGTRFQKLVWRSIEAIPFGKSKTYSQIAAEIGGRSIARTVGNACGSNPLPLMVPCHRVIASNGLLTGYVGGLWRKKWLLEHEGVLQRELFG